jgi:hypothetical protein
VKVVLKTTACDLRIAGVVIGLTLAVVHILGLPITGTSVNPARSFGPALILQGEAWHQLWLFIVVPSVAGILAGICSRCCCCACKSCIPSYDCGMSRCLMQHHTNPTFPTYRDANACSLRKSLPFCFSTSS